MTGADVQTTSACEVVDKDLVICNLTTDRAFQAEIEVRKGRGYVTAEENSREEQEIGVIPIDSIFSPVQRVRYRMQSTRVGKLTNYDRLILEVWTDGTVTPEHAPGPSKIYRKHLNPFIQFFDIGKELPWRASHRDGAAAHARVHFADAGLQHALAPHLGVARRRRPPPRRGGSDLQELRRRSSCPSLPWISLCVPATAWEAEGTRRSAISWAVSTMS